MEGDVGDRALKRVFGVESFFGLLRRCFVDGVETSLRRNYGREHFAMSYFSDIHAVLLAGSIFLGAYCLFSFKKFVSASPEQRRQRLRMFAFTLVVFALLLAVQILYRSSTGLLR